MKKFLAVVMTAVLAMSMMTACGSSKSSKENKDTTAAKALRITSCLQNSFNALARDDPYEYARLDLDGKIQVWVDAVDSQVLFLWEYK